jgi:hypothetical protein
MSYQEQNELSANKDFRGRVRMCVAEQAQIFVNDDRSEYKQLALQAITALDPTTDQFVPLVSSRPAMTTESADGDIMAAVQYVWPLIGSRYTPMPLPPVPQMAEVP